MGVAFIRCVDANYAAPALVLAHKDAAAGVVTQAASRFNAVHFHKPLAREYSVLCYLAERNDQADLSAWLRQYNPDVIYCFECSYLLKAKVLAVSEFGRSVYASS